MNNPPVIDNKKIVEIDEIRAFLPQEEIKVKEVKFTGGNSEKFTNIKGGTEYRTIERLILGWKNRNIGCIEML